MLAVLCDENGHTECGTDSYVHVDGRCSLNNRIKQAREYRERFKRHFQHKYDSWTHVMLVRSIKELPDSYNGLSMPHRYPF